MYARTLVLGCFLAAAAPLPAQTTNVNQLFAGSHITSGERFSVETIGHGPDVVLIPGLASSRATFRRTATELKDRYTVHLIQVNGFAGEPAGSNAAGPLFDPLVESLSAYLKSFGHPVPVIGHSLGGTLGLAIAERHPGLMSRLLLVDTLPFYAVVMAGPTATVDTVRPMVAQMRSKPAQAMPEQAERAMASQMVTAPADVDRVVGWMKASDAQVVVDAMTDDMLADLRPGLSTVNVPVTVLYETPLRSLMEAGYAPLRGVKLVEVPNAKHFIMDDQPARFDAEVGAFLK